MSKSQPHPNSTKRYRFHGGDGGYNIPITVKPAVSEFPVIRSYDNSGLEDSDELGDYLGSLLSVELSKVPFTPKRIFLTHNVPNQTSRGYHANTKSKQLLICASGCIGIRYHDGIRWDYVILTEGRSILLNAMTWNELTFYDDAMLLSICSEPYNKNDYINSFEEFLDESKYKRGE